VVPGDSKVYKIMGMCAATKPIKTPTGTLVTNNIELLFVVQLCWVKNHTVVPDIELPIHPPTLHILVLAAKRRLQGFFLKFTIRTKKTKAKNEIDNMGTYGSGNKGVAGVKDREKPSLHVLLHQLCFANVERLVMWGQMAGAAAHLPELLAFQREKRGEGFPQLPPCPAATAASPVVMMACPPPES